MTGGQKNLQTLLGLSHADVWEVEETIRYVQSLSRPLKDSLRHILQRRNGAYGGSHIELKNTACIRHASARRESLAIFLQQPVKVARLPATLQFVTRCG